MSTAATPSAIGDLPPNAPKPEDVFTPEILAKYHPDVVKFVCMALTPGRPPASHEVPIAEVRANPAKFAGPWCQDSTGLPGVTDNQFSSEDGAVIPVKVYHPDPAKFGDGPYPAHLNFHGGGFVFGDLTSEAQLCLSMRDGAGIVVIDVNYRHCPEAIFGSAFQDAWAAYQWVRSSPTALNINPDSISAGGISAGAHLTIVLQHLARDAGTPLRLSMPTVPPSTALMMMESYEESPFKSLHEFAHGPILPWARIKYFGEMCFPPEKREEIRRTYPSWWFAPIKATNWRGIGPTFLRTGEVDPLRDEGEAYGMKLVEGGNEVKFKRYIGCPHTFPFFGWLPEKQQYDVDSITALKEAHGLK
ncbi:alpha/beta-hydrolase [Xylariaceae sp. FL0255]|nr:alpha/beta-hydrolase [Xylariaceae sp. FL0255]